MRSKTELMNFIKVNNYDVDLALFDFNANKLKEKGLIDLDSVVEARPKAQSKAQSEKKVLKVKEGGVKKAKTGFLNNKSLFKNAKMSVKEGEEQLKSKKKSLFGKKEVEPEEAKDQQPLQKLVIKMPFGSGFGKSKMSRKETSQIRSYFAPSGGSGDEEQEHPDLGSGEELTEAVNKSKSPTAVPSGKKRGRKPKKNLADGSELTTSPLNESRGFSVDSSQDDTISTPPPAKKKRGRPKKTETSGYFKTGEMISLIPKPHVEVQGNETTSTAETPSPAISPVPNENGSHSSSHSSKKKGPGRPKTKQTPVKHPEDHITEATAGSKTPKRKIEEEIDKAVKRKKLDLEEPLPQENGHAEDEFEKLKESEELSTKMIADNQETEETVEHYVSLNQDTERLVPEGTSSNDDKPHLNEILSESSPTITPPPKKRGRPPKAKTPMEGNISLNKSEDSSNANSFQPALHSLPHLSPKKRGRPPKNKSGEFTKTITLDQQDQSLPSEADDSHSKVILEEMSWEDYQRQLEPDQVVPRSGDTRKSLPFEDTENSLIEFLSVQNGITNKEPCEITAEMILGNGKS